jgi:hypothetical protein
MEREKQADTIDEQTRAFLEKNPSIAEALRVFELSYAQYQKAMQGYCSFYTSTCTTPQPQPKLESGQ